MGSTRFFHSLASGPALRRRNLIGSGRFSDTGPGETTATRLLIAGDTPGNNRNSKAPVHGAYFISRLTALVLAMPVEAQGMFSIDNQSFVPIRIFKSMSEIAIRERESRFAVFR